MKISLTRSTLVSAFAVVLHGVASAQAIPAGVGTVTNVAFPLTQLGGSFNYAVNAAELISTGYYNSGTAYSTDVSGDLAYLSSSQKYPFSAIYSGGVLVANSNQPTTVFQSLSLTQSLNTKSWNFQVQDAVSYLPESPVDGLSGIPGVGDIGIDPVPVGPESGIGILTTYGPRVSNTITGTASRVITGRLSGQVSGYDGIQRFIGDNAAYAVDSDTYGGSGGVTYHIDGRSQVSGNYVYSRFNYVGTPYAFTSEGATIDYSRQWNRHISTDTYIGPQHIVPSDPVFGSSSTDIAAGATLSYSARSAFYTLGYNRGVNNGSGVIAGSFSDNVIGGVHRQFGRAWSASGSLGYSRTTSLPVLNIYNYAGDSVTAGGQVVRSLGRRFAGFASYTIEEQTTDRSTAALNAFNGIYQVFGIGISYSPGSLFLGR